ncbi:ABC transporter permease [Microlunatus endophyticus]|uniref:ABC transporter permease n=1 Tax=Microlunatus endophyticus TaxID=1716077 RepID=A0A917W8D5_9ACTN|nr:ABC transporter permease [Microlunatus endophyticus]GGL78195.1 ABC transporter permease [Microlunatus endophyticus]
MSGERTTAGSLEGSVLEPGRSLETAALRRQRLSVGILISVVGLLLLGLLAATHGTARFALSNAFDPVQLPTVSLPGLPLVLVCGLLCVAAGAGLLTGRLAGRFQTLAGTVGGVGFLVGFLTWAAAGRALPFPVSNQIAQTFAVATPLVLGALAGVLCERAGVINVAIEGQFLVAAQAAAVVGTVTQSIAWAIIAAALAGVGMAALLAVFAIKYRVNQVVLGVVLNLLASGITGFLLDQRFSQSNLNSAPVMSSIAIPGLSKIPFIGPVVFDQNILAYLAGISVPVVWVLLFKTSWGLRVRSVGEHPRAADTVGISVTGMRWSAVLVGGVFAGIGGAFFILAATGHFTRDFTNGSGFIALAAVIMGRWHPGWAALMAIFFGFATELGSQVQTLNTPVPSDFLQMLPYVATVIAVAGLIGRVRPPASDGEPYQKA